MAAARPPAGKPEVSPARPSPTLGRIIVTLTLIAAVGIGLIALAMGKRMVAERRAKVMAKPPATAPATPSPAPTPPPAPTP